MHVADECNFGFRKETILQSSSDLGILSVRAGPVGIVAVRSGPVGILALRSGPVGILSVRVGPVGILAVRSGPDKDSSCLVRLSRDTSC